MSSKLRSKLNNALKMEKEFDESIVIQKYLHTIGIELKVQS
jgi:hypothetical protein